MVWRRHVDQLFDAATNQVDVPQNSAEHPGTSQDSDEYVLMTPDYPPSNTVVPVPEVSETSSSQSLPQSSEHQVKSYPECVRNPPQKLDL